MQMLQATIMRSILTKENWEMLRPLLEDDTFSDTVSRRLYKVVQRLHGEDLGDIPIIRLKLDIESSFSLHLDTKAEMLAAVSAVEEAPEEGASAVKATLQRFISKQRSLKTAHYIVAHNDDEDYDPSIPLDILQGAVDVTGLTGDDPTSLEDAMSPGAPTREKVIGLGFCPKFDACLDGGIANGEQAFILAPSGVGKTSYMWAAATYAANQGANVLGITLEINKAKCFQRIDQYNTGMDKYELSANPVRAMKRRKMAGNIWVQDWCHRTVQVEDIRNLILRMRAQGKDIDYLLLDQLENVSPRFNNRNQPRFNYSETAKDLRACGNELGFRQINGWQTNKLASDKHVLQKTDVGEDWGIFKNADIVIALNQNAEELRQKMLRVNILKQRESTDRSISSLYSDLDRMRIYPLDWHDTSEVPGRFAEDG